MARITNFTTLKAAVLSWMDRTDASSADVEGFIQHAEARICRFMRVKEMEAVASITTDSLGVATLPSGFLSFKVVYDSDNAIVPHVTPEAYVTTGENDTKVYTLLGAGMRLAPAAAETLTAVYYERPDAITSSNETNWLLTAHPDLYLFGTLAAWSSYIDDTPGMAKWDASFNRSLLEVQASERRDRYSGPLARTSPITQVRGYRA